MANIAGLPQGKELTEQQVKDKLKAHDLGDIEKGDYFFINGMKWTVVNVCNDEEYGVGCDGLRLLQRENETQRR